MTLVSSTGSRARSLQDRSGGTSTSPPTRQVEAAVPLPRHLLVALAGISADVTSLRQRHADDPQLHEPLDRILDSIDGLVDSVYDRATDSHGR